MTYILQIDFPITGPFGIEMTEAFSELARSITKEPGFLWKIWTENENAQEVGNLRIYNRTRCSKLFNNAYPKINSTRYYR